MAMFVVAAVPLAAQTVPGGAPGDSGAVIARSKPRPPQNFWIGAGVGAATYPYGSLAAIVDGWYARGPFAIGARHAGTATWFGEQRSDDALLVGARTGDEHFFWLGAIGPGVVASERTCDGPCGIITRPRTPGLAYTFEAHANAKYGGVAISMFGALGSASRYNAFALSMNFGMFGR